MPDQQDIIASIIPKRGRGPGRILFKSGLEVSTFEPSLLRTAAENVGKEARMVWIEKPAKDPEKPPYKNLTALEILGGQLTIKDPAITVREVGEAKALVPITQKAELQIPPQNIEQMEQGFALAVRRYELLQDFIRKHFVKDVHYNDGAMFNASKDVLLQPGAHMIAHAYGYSLLPEVVSGPMEPPKEADAPYTIVIKTTVMDSRGRIVGAAFGAATSTIWSGKQGRYVGRAIDPDKSFNSTLKMAVKRSVVASVRQSTDAASLFVEDVEEGGYGEMRESKGFIRKSRVR